MAKFPSAPLIAAAFLMTFTTAPVWAGHVTVTPLGSHTGEFCKNDRALLFTDHNGTTLLYDPGRTVTGGDDPRLPVGLDIVLLTSVHSDHIGEKRIADVDINDTEPDPDINCANPDLSVDTRPESTVDSILSAFPGAKIWVGGEMSKFFGKRHPGQAQTLRPGGTRTKDGVKVHVIPAFHSNGIDASLLTGNNQLTNPAGKKTKGLTQHTLPGELDSNGLTAYVGPDHGYIIEFTNGLVVYLTGDTGQFGDMKHIVRDFYGPQLAVVHLGGTFGMGPDEGVFATVSLIQPASVIVTHVNEEATISGVLQPGTTKDFVDGIAGGSTIPVHVPTSGDTMEFDSNGVCQSGPPPCAP